MEWIQSISWEKIHFLDECHLFSKHLRRRKGIGPRGEVLKTVNKENDLSTTFSLTLLTTLNGNAESPFYYTIREESNSGEDFLGP